MKSFANELRKSGIDARLDAFRDESQSIDDFMMVELERADFVLAICTPGFKQKILENAEGTGTASGFEIGTAAALRRIGGKDVIPVLREGEWADAAPSNLLSYRFYDFTRDDVSEEFEQLKNRLLGYVFAVIGPLVGGTLIYLGFVYPESRLLILIPGTYTNEIVAIGFITLISEPIATSFSAFLIYHKIWKL